jgi:tetratricopeptide (TPR) repeat protein
MRWSQECSLNRVGTKKRKLWLLPVFLVVTGLFASAVAQTPQGASGCKGPPDLEAALASQPSAAVYDALGAYFGNEHQVSCAISAFESGTRLNPEGWEGYYDLAIILVSKGDFERAVRELKTAAGLASQMPQVHLDLGLALNHLNRFEEAISEFKIVLQSDPSSVPTLGGLANALIAEKRYSAAISYLKGAPPNDLLQSTLAAAYEKNGDNDAAIQEWSAIVHRDPLDAQAHSNLALAYVQQSRYRQAAVEFQETLRLDPTEDSVRVSYVTVLILLAQYATALPVIQDYLHRNPHDSHALYLAGVVNQRLGNYADAETVLRQAVAIDPRSGDTRYSLGCVLLRLEKLREAREQFETVLQLNPGSNEARFQLATALRLSGQQDQAREELKIFEEEKAEGAKKSLAAIQANQARDYLQAGDAQKATELYRVSITQDPENPRTYYDLALALDLLHDDGGEQGALEKSIALDPNFPPAHNQLGKLTLRLGRPAPAEAQFKEAISLNPQYAEAQNNLGVLYGQVGRNAEAEQLFRQATENDPKFGPAFVNLGLILASQSRFAQAQEAVHRALQLNPDNAAALAASTMISKSMSQDQTGHGTDAQRK